MDILLLGGTGWLGRTIAESGLRQGHDVTCLVRGHDVPPGVHLVRADRSEDDALSPVRDHHWDAVVDVVTDHELVARAARDLAETADFAVYVSSASVYAEHDRPGLDETAALIPADADADASTAEGYGVLKHACEMSVQAAFGPARSAVVRPCLIAGPRDRSWRTVYWPWRFDRNESSPVLVPDDPQLPCQVIDARDLADWIVLLAENRISGVRNACGDPLPLAEYLRRARQVAGATGPMVEASTPWLLQQGVSPWAGPRSLPLWLGDLAWRGMNARSNALARQAGLNPRPLAQTLADTLSWARGVDVRIPHSGLSDAEESQLLAAWAARQV